MGGREVEGNDSTVILMLSNGYYLFSNIPPHPRPDRIGAPVSPRRGSFAVAYKDREVD